jgi:hypothetical protein
MHWTRDPRSSRFWTILVVLLVVVLAAPGMASAKPGKTSQVGDEFHDVAPPRKIECVWSGGDHTYWCSGDNYRDRLSTPDGGGLLRAGGNPPEWNAANPRRFDCTGTGAAAKPSDFQCSYRHNGHRHEFRMHEMLIMTDPYPGTDQSITYVWPPHK